MLDLELATVNVSNIGWVSLMRRTLAGLSVRLRSRFYISLIIIVAHDVWKHGCRVFRNHIQHVATI
jgi:hypothetical protein